MEGWDLRALAVLERLNAAGHRAVLVGGCVRDRLMGRTPHDYDAATSARPEQIREACAPMRVVETGVRHGTVTVLSGGLPVEVTTFRREGTYSDHRHPDQVDGHHSSVYPQLHCIFKLKDIGPENGRKRHQERKPDGKFPVESPQHSHRDGCARSREAGNGGHGLCAAHNQGIHYRGILGCLSALGDTVGKEEQKAGGNQCAGDKNRVAEERVHLIFDQ